MVPLWIDTDVGDNPDDAVSLLLAGAHPEIELAGVSTVGGDVEWRARVARRLVGDATPVVAGSLGDADQVLAIGPLTNLVGFEGTATIMGGVREATEHRGGAWEVETNFGADPGAARTVLATPGRLIVPLDVTSRMVLTSGEVAALRGAHRELAEQLDRWPHAVCLHDPLALLVAVGDVESSERRERLTVDDAGRVVRGRGAEHRVVVDADTEAAKARVLELLRA